MTLTVLIADDQQLMRAALRTCLEAEPDISVVGEAGNGGEAVRLAARLRPAVVVMDVRMPVMDGLEATRRITGLDLARPPRVLVMTTFDLDEYIIDALRAGASGFLIKDAPPEELIRAVRVIDAGEALLAPSITRRLLDLRARTLPPVSTARRDAALAGITARELEVLKLVARGLSNLEIAQALDVAPSSVKTHVGHLLAKLGFNDRVHLVVFAYEHELVRPGSVDAGEEDRPDAAARTRPRPSIR
jgi:DNA-binding NarL/FixJ family response regulator